METVKFNCPYCAKELEINPEFAGEKVPCPFCAGELALTAPMLAGEPVEVYRACPFCGEKILKAAKKCKHCSEFINIPGETPEEILWTGNPSIFHFSLAFFIGLILLPFGIGFIIMGALILKVRSMRYFLTDRKIRTESGIFSREIHEIKLKDIQAVSIRKSFLDGIFGTGSIIVCPAGADAHRLVLSGVGDPEGVNSLISDARDRLPGI